MFIHTEESLQEFEDYIEQLEEKVGLTPETYKEVKTAISRERTKLKKLIIADVVLQSEQLPKTNCTLNIQTCGKGSACKYPHCHI